MFKVIKSTFLNLQLAFSKTSFHTLWKFTSYKLQTNPPNITINYIKISTISFFSPRIKFFTEQYNSVCFLIIKNKCILLVGNNNNEEEKN